jgi:chemotaxis protein MotB
VPRFASPRPSASFISTLALLVALPLAGCVTKGKYNDVLAERDALATENAALMQATESLSEERAELSYVASALSEELSLRDKQVAVLKQEQMELADEVERWMVAGMIKMELLADGLHLLLPHDVLFRTGSAELKPEGAKILTELVGELAQVPYEIAVLGYTDNVPVGKKLAERFPSNWELSGARAASVVRLMQAKGIPGHQMIVVALGDTRPIASNDTPEGRSENRRIEVRLRPIIP